MRVGVSGECKDVDRGGRFVNSSEKDGVSTTLYYELDIKQRSIIEIDGRTSQATLVSS